MKFNWRELAVAASLPNPDKEGKLAYKKPQKATGFKDKWFRLKGNLLFYYSWDSISTGSTFDFSSPQGVIVLERIRVQHEPHHPEQSFVFSISFEPQEGSDSHMGSYDYASVAKAKHYFSGRTVEDCEDWVQRFRKSSTESLKSHILVLQAKILNLTGVDPLDAFFMNPKVDFRNTGGGLKLHHLVDIPNPPSVEEVEDPRQKLHHANSTSLEDPLSKKQKGHEDEIDDVDDHSRTLTKDSSTLTPSSNGLDVAIDDGMSAASSPVCVVDIPVIVVEVEDDSRSPPLSPDAIPPVGTASSSSSPFGAVRHPSRPSIIAESQRLTVVNSSSLSDSDSDSSSSGSPVSSPKAIKAAANAEKREKMPRKPAPRKAVYDAAAAVQLRLAMIKLDEDDQVVVKDDSKETVSDLTSSNSSDNASAAVPEDVVGVDDDAAANADVKTDESELSRQEEFLPRAPPRHRTRSRKSNSIRKQLSLIEEEEKARSATMASDELHQIEDIRAVLSDDDSSETADHCRPDLGQGNYRPVSSDPNHKPFSHVEEERLGTTNDATTTITEYAPSTVGLGSANTADKLSEANFARDSYGKNVDVALDGSIDYFPPTSAVYEDIKEAQTHSAEKKSVTTDSHWYGNDVTANEVERDGGGGYAGDVVVKSSAEDDVADGVMQDRVGAYMTMTNDGMINATTVNGTSANGFAVNEKYDKENIQPCGDNVHDEKGGSLPTDAPDLPNANDHEIVGTLQTDPKEAIGEMRPNWVESPRMDVNVEAKVTVTPDAEVVENEAKSNSTPEVLEPTQLIDNGPKPKPRIGQRSSLRLSALLPTPTRPKRKPNLAKTKSTSALPKQSSFKSFLLDDNDEGVEKAIAGRESNA